MGSGGGVWKGKRIEGICFICENRENKNLYEKIGSNLWDSFKINLIIVYGKKFVICFVCCNLFCML